MTSNQGIRELLGQSPKAHARITGLVGLVVLASGSFSGVVASRLIVRGDIPATLSNIIASESLFRLGITSGLIMMIAWLLYASLLYQLLKPVHKVLALIMLVLVIASVPIYMLNQATQFAALVLAPDKLFDDAEVFLQMHRFGALVAAIFFGLWLFPLGLLVFRSGFLPKLLGAFLMIGSMGYLVQFVQAFHFPGFEGGLWTNPFLVVTHVSELALLLWLLVRGLDVRQWECAVLSRDVEPAVAADPAAPRG